MTLKALTPRPRALAAVTVLASLVAVACEPPPPAAAPTAAVASPASAPRAGETQVSNAGPASDP
ncbi:MAG: hypothetical protein FWD17_16350, partial [Polyangiaceae bacterium]|nr:hypothetical protein [Polyangiaceae bacterium]